jgi:hypothetical protein
MPKQNYILVEQILIDLSKLVNLPFTEADEGIERLGGLMVQPTSTNTQQFQTAVGYFQSNGATTLAAENLAIIVSNLSKISGVSVGKLIRQIENADDITFTENFYININNIRHKESQWFKSTPSLNDRALYKFKVNCFCPAPSDFYIVVADTDVVSDWPYLTIFEWASEVKFIVNVTSGSSSKTLTSYDSEATWEISLILHSTTLYPVDAGDSVELGGVLSYGHMMEMPIDEVAMGYSMHDGTYEQVIWYIDYGPDIDEVEMGFDMQGSTYEQVIWYIDYGPDTDEVEMGFDLVDGTLINKLVEADSPDESLQLGCAIDSSSSMTPV